MQLLNPDQYHKLSEPLKKVTFNNLFARWVAEGHLAGKIYVDNIESPETYYVVHPYGMSLLFGKSTNCSFNENFRKYALNMSGDRKRFEWMQAFPGEWDSVLKELFKEHLIKSSENIFQQEEKNIELNTRINFRFNRHIYDINRQVLNDPDCMISTTTGRQFAEMQGSVVPARFWKDAAHFIEKGIGFSLCYKDKLASTAYSAFLLDRKLEIGIETKEEFRGKGFAVHTCSSLIDYCLENGYEPVWACKLENTQSFRLARKLGFEPAAEIPYYRLGM